MTTGHQVYLLTGPRAAGKSSYFQKLLVAQSELHGVSRDEILIHIFGSEHLSGYGGEFHFADEEVVRRIKDIFSTASPAKVILDSWTGTRLERSHLIQKLRRLGAVQVVALHFTTPVELVEEWFWKKPGIAKCGEMKTRPGENLVYYSEDAPRRDFKMFHELAAGIESDGFDEVVRIDPTQPLVIL